LNPRIKSFQGFGRRSTPLGHAGCSREEGLIVILIGNKKVFSPRGEERKPSHSLAIPVDTGISVEEQEWSETD
jgi:hypothetical protein